MFILYVFWFKMVTIIGYFGNHFFWNYFCFSFPLVADKAYTSRENYNLANEIGAIAYLPFKSKDTDKSRGSMTWKRMYHYFQLNRDEFMEHYHQRSNVESTMNMVKAKFGDKLKSKNHKAQENELLCKLIAHNICVVIMEMNELGVNPNFRV